MKALENFVKRRELETNHHTGLPTKSSSPDAFSSLQRVTTNKTNKKNFSLESTIVLS